MANSNRGFASMNEDKQKDIASKGGQAGGGNLRKDTHRASEAGKRGAQAQPTAAKQQGGHNSHRNG